MSGRGTHRVSQRYVTNEMCAYTKTPTEELEQQVKSTVTWQPSQSLIGSRLSHATARDAWCLPWPSDGEGLPGGVAVEISTELAADLFVADVQQ